MHVHDFKPSAGLREWICSITRMLEIAVMARFRPGTDRYTAELERLRCAERKGFIARAAGDALRTDLSVNEAFTRIRHNFFRGIWTKDLNSVPVETDYGLVPQKDFSCSGTAHGEFSLYTKDLARHACEWIAGADAVVGCMAWLTEPTILEALRTKMGVSLLVQKEDWLRPDIHWSQAEQRVAYDKLPGLSRDTHSRGISCASSDPCPEAVRVVGNCFADKRVSPRMHHKFVLFGKLDRSRDVDDGFEFCPYAVWMGSFNWTKNGGMSFEDAIVLTDPTVVTALYEEYIQLLVLSEPLDWESPYIEPEWRFGT